jgi:hypothetical protein
MCDGPAEEAGTRGHRQVSDVPILDQWRVVLDPIMQAAPQGAWAENSYSKREGSEVLKESQNHGGLELGPNCLAISIEVFEHEDMDCGGG